MSKSNNSVKLIAFHLPQFHTFPENNEWWGEGFTEWTNTKKAIKVFPKHNQPREPLDDHYYDLSNLTEMLWQMKLAEKYEVSMPIVEQINEVLFENKSAAQAVD